MAKMTHSVEGIPFWTRIKRWFTGYTDKEAVKPVYIPDEVVLLGRNAFVEWEPEPLNMLEEVEYTFLSKEKSLC